MKIDQVTTIVDGLPHMRKPAGTRIYDHVLEHHLRRVLELGTYYGVSTCYLGAAVDETDTSRRSIAGSPWISSRT